MPGSSRQSSGGSWLLTAVIITVLVGSVWLLRSAFGIHERGSAQTWMFFGMSLAGAFAAGWLLSILKIPKITGYLLVGVLLSPSVTRFLPEAWHLLGIDAGFLTAQRLADLNPFKVMCLSLVALITGGSLKIESLKGEVRQVFGIALSQALIVLLLVFGLLLSVSGGIPRFSIDVFRTLAAPDKNALAILLAAMTLVTSPAATMAVIQEGKARGPMSRTVLSVVLIKDVLAMLGFGILIAMIGGTVIANGVSREGWALLVHFAASIASGCLLGALIGLYVRYVKSQVIWVVLGASYATTFIAVQSHLDSFVLFLAAGFVATNFSDRTSQLIEMIKKWSLPLFLIVFTLEGAKLDLSVLPRLAPVIFGLVVLRIAALWLGVFIASKLAGLDPNTDRFGWLGFVSQATYVAPFIAILASGFGESGRLLTAVLLGCIVVNELIGPVLFRIGLGFAGELATEPRAETSREPPRRSEPRTPSARWVAAQSETALPWGAPSETSSIRLNKLIGDLEADMQALVRDIVQTAFEPFRADAESYFRELRREFLRFHRRTLVEARSADKPESIPPVFRRELADLADRWRGIVLDRGARLGSYHWRPVQIVDALDRLIEEVPRYVDAPHENATFEARPGDPLARRAWRAGLRLKRMLYRGFGGTLPPRPVNLREVAQYHLTGRIPAKLEGLVALLINGENFLADRTTNLFESVLTGYEVLTDRLDAGDEPSRLISQLTALRREFELELALSLEDTNGIVKDGKLRATRILGEGLQSVKADVVVSNTPDLPVQARRFGKVFKERTQGRKLLSEDYETALAGCAAHYSVLALDLELLGLEETIRGPVEDHARQLARLLRGRGRKQIERVLEALDVAITNSSQAFSSDKTCSDLAAELRGIVEAFTKVSQDAAQATGVLRDNLTDEQAATPLLDRLFVSSQSLTDRYLVPAQRPSHGEWHLPPPIPTVEIPFRKAVVGFVQTTVTKRLITVTREFANRSRPMAEAVEELERVVAFNFEVAGSELDVLADESVPTELADTTREMVVGQLQRGRERLQALLEDSEPWAQELESGVVDAVLGALQDLRTRAAEGKLSPLRPGLLRDGGVGRRLVDEARGLRGIAESVRDQTSGGLRNVIGEERLEDFARWLGLDRGDPDLPIAPEVFALQENARSLPTSYRRLFSGQVLEAGDVLTGRETELARARTVLTRHAIGRLRAVAVAGPEGVGNGAVVNTIVRGLGSMRLRRIDLSEPCSVEEVESWFSDSAGNQLTVLTGFRYLFAMKHNGFEPLRTFVRGVIDDAGRDAWLVSAESTIWRFASRAAPVSDAFPEIIELKPLTPEQLQSSIMARHQMSGYGLAVQSDASWWLRRLLTRDADQAKHARDAWFKTLHAATGGLLQDALQVWLASIENVQEEAKKVELGPVPRRPMAALRRLPDPLLLTLRQTCLQGWLDEDLYAGAFRVSELEARAHLAHLVHLGLMLRNEDRYLIAPHLLAPVQRVLREKGWLT